MQKYPLLIRLTFLLLFFILLIFALIEVRNFLYPLTLAILFAYLIYPIVKFLERHGFPRILANLICILSAIIVMSTGVYLISTQAGVFVEEFPDLKEQAYDNIEALNQSFNQKMGLSVELGRETVKEGISNIFETGSDFFQTAFTATSGTVAKAALLPVYVFFLLYYRNKFADFLLRLIPAEKHKKTLKILGEISHVTKKYMTGIFIVVLILCVLNTIGLLIIGIKYALLLGIISALFNFIPYFGTLIGGAVPLLFTLLMSPHPEKAVAVIILFLIIQFTENNILTPNIVGGNVRLNPFITILAIIVGGMIWALPGMFIAVPFLGMFKIACEHIKALHPYSYLLGTKGTERHALTLSKIKGLFKKSS